MSDIHKAQLYSGILDILNDKKYYYRSRVGSEYSKWTEEGQKALIDYVTHMAPYILKKEDEKLIELSKKMVWDELHK